MNWHIFERVTTKLTVLGAAAATAVVASTEDWLDLASKVEPQWWVVVWMAGMTAFMVRWQSKQGKTAHRSPNGELSRLRQELITEQAARQRLEVRVDSACERLARIEGALSGLVEVPK